VYFLNENLHLGRQKNVKDNNATIVPLNIWKNERTCENYVSIKLFDRIFLLKMKQNKLVLMKLYIYFFKRFYVTVITFIIKLFDCFILTNKVLPKNVWHCTFCKSYCYWYNKTRFLLYFIKLNGIIVEQFTLLEIFSDQKYGQLFFNGFWIHVEKTLQRVHL
jgi:hypothetical protein